MKQNVFYFLLIFLFGFIALPVQAQSLSMNIMQWSGEKDNVEVRSIDKITFTENDLIMNYGAGNSESLDMLSIRKMTFSSNFNGIINIVDSEDKISVFFNSSNQLIINNLPEGKHTISIYSILGNLIQNTIVNSVSPVVITGSIEKGIYIVKVNNQALKFVKS
jgi:hypothetical protein